MLQFDYAMFAVFNHRWQKHLRTKENSFEPLFPFFPFLIDFSEPFQHLNKALSESCLERFNRKSQAVIL